MGLEASIYFLAWDAMLISGRNIHDPFFLMKQIGLFCFLQWDMFLGFRVNQFKCVLCDKKEKHMAEKITQKDTFAWFCFALLILHISSPYSHSE